MQWTLILSDLHLKYSVVTNETFTTDVFNIIYIIYIMAESLSIEIEYLLTQYHNMQCTYTYIFIYAIHIYIYFHNWKNEIYYITLT